MADRYDSGKRSPPAHQTSGVAGVFAIILMLAFGMRSAAAADRWTIIHAGTLIAVPGEGVRNNVSVIIRNSRIVEVRPGFVAGASVAEREQVEVIDLSKEFVLPGLIDSHVHLTEQIDRESQLALFTKTDPDVTVDTVVFAQRTIMAGFTTVRDLGAFSPGTIMAVRDGVQAGKITGPRIVAAGQGLSPLGGHGDLNGFRDDSIRPLPSICNGADDCRRAVRYQVKHGADVIKIYATGGVLDNSRAGLEQAFTDDEMLAIVQSAHGLGRKVAAHAHGSGGIKAALRAGVDSIEHGTFADDEGLRLLKEKGAYLVPTLLPAVVLAERAKIPDYYPAAVREKASAIIPLVGSHLTKAIAAGCKIAFGTDSAVSDHGQNAKQFALMVDAGMKPIDAIRAATLNAAELLGLEDEVGSVVPGKAADLIATDRSPLEDVNELTNINFVMQNGRVVKSAAPVR